jgi:predicted lipid-binding transport protein (Tim44 family)
MVNLKIFFKMIGLFGIVVIIAIIQKKTKEIIPFFKEYLSKCYGVGKKNEE